MGSLFISHSSRDNAVAAEVTARLKALGYRSLFLDFDPEDGIPAGRSWEQELYQQLRESRAVIVLCSEHSMASDWCFAEITHARALGKRIFPVRIGPCTLRPQLTEAQVIDLTTDPDQAYERLRRGLVAAGLDPADMFAWDGSRPPYPGLMAFQEADAAVFFGREVSVRDTLDLLNRLRRFGGPRVAVLLGASGSGKSSLARAGVVPRLRRDPDAWLVVGPFRPLQRPLDELALALADAFAASGAAHPQEDILRRLSETGDPTGPPVLADLAEELRRGAKRRGATVTLVIDQLEELLAPGRGADAARFLALLAACVHAPASPLMVLATLRSDFLGELQAEPVLGTIPFESVQLGPLPVDAFAQVIEGPARVAGLELESGLVQVMVDDTETHDALPLLAFTLRELWERYGEDGRLTVEEYRDKLGGLDGSVARAAEAVLAAEPLTPEQEEGLREAFVSMVRINEEGQYARRPALWHDLPARSRPILERFVAARLLISDTQVGEAVLEVAHEALFRTWKRLKLWLDEDREALRLREGLRQAAQDWDAGGRDPQLLLHRGGRLEAAEALTRRPRFALAGLLHDYLQACLAQRQAEKDAERRQEVVKRRRLWSAIGALVVGVTVSSSLALWAKSERDAAREGLAGLHWVTAVSERDRNGDPLKAGHHFVRAAELAREPAQAHNARLAVALLGRAVRLSAVLDHGAPIRLASLSRDGNRVRSWGDDGSTKEWDVRTGAAISASQAESGIDRVRASPGGRRLLVWNRDGMLQVRDGVTGEPLASTRHADGSPVFDPAEDRVLTWSADGTALVRDLAGRRALGELATGGPVQGATFDRRGRRVVTWSEGGRGQVWNTETGERIAGLPSGAGILGAVFSADGTRVLVWREDGSAAVWGLKAGGASVPLRQRGESLPGAVGALFFAGDRRILTWNYAGSGTARVWDSATGAELATLRHDGQELIRGAVLSRDEGRILTWGDDDTARVWDSASGEALHVLRHRGDVKGAAFSPDERAILTWGDDSTARAWHSLTGEALGLPMTYGGGAARFSEGGERVLTWGADGAARVWQVDARQGPVLLSALPRVYRATLTADGRRILALCADGTLRAWDAGGEPHGTFALEAEVLGGVFTQDGTRLLTWAGSHAVRLWRTDGGQPLTPPLAHEPSSLGILGTAFGPGERWLLSWGDDHTVRIRDAASGADLQTLRHPSAVTGVASSADGTRVLSWGTDNAARLWDTGTGRELASFSHDHEVAGGALPADRHRVVTWSRDGLVQAWEVGSTTPIRLLRHGDELRGAAFSADGQRLLTWGENTARLWDNAGHEVAPSLNHPAPVMGGQFSHDRSRVVTWDADGAIRFWDSENGQPLTPALRHPGPPVGVTLGPGEHEILAWGLEAVQAWPLPSEVEDIAGESVILRQEVLTGTRLNAVGELEVLSAEEWAGKRKQIGTGD